MMRFSWPLRGFAVWLSTSRAGGVEALSSSRLPSIRSHATASSALRETMYTINDEICAPTDRKVLRKLINRNCASLPRFLQHKPIAVHTQVAFDAIESRLHSSDSPIILDSGCGTGRSSLLLGEMYPTHLILGVDRSFVRLNKNSRLKLPEEGKAPWCAASSNVLLIRAELVDFWRLLLAIPSIEITHHFMLYPNPYPVPKLLKQRWYGHPAMPLMFQLGGEILIRSNWKGYLQEFSDAIEYANEYYEQQEQENPAALYLKDALQGPVERIDKKVAWTNFERKFDRSGEPTFELLLRPMKRR